MQFSCDPFSQLPIATPESRRTLKSPNSGIKHHTQEPCTLTIPNVNLRISNIIPERFFAIQSPSDKQNHLSPFTGNELCYLKLFYIGVKFATCSLQTRFTFLSRLIEFGCQARVTVFPPLFTSCNPCKNFVPAVFLQFKLD
ncbi:unnamed protein product [Sphenostylis stenocarpa]|uniref:Uncharacterized protein n=1 Tax=Sphenostylis stenocarpa TaxID=92480 RepID=A0AA86T804_9FABA|nr:unnamed protein product [Sphenostylis stenocarpa]